MKASKQPIYIRQITHKGAEKIGAYAQDAVSANTVEERPKKTFLFHLRTLEKVLSFMVGWHFGIQGDFGKERIL